MTEDSQAMGAAPTKRSATIEITSDQTNCRVVISSLVMELKAGPQSRARSLAITKLEEAFMWLGESLRVDD